jgi:membrane peptidoglycan carboxypeptidase
VAQANLPGAPDRNSETWMVGYTPQLATAVWVGDDVRSARTALRDRSGRDVTGR